MTPIAALAETWRHALPLGSTPTVGRSRRQRAKSPEPRSPCWSTLRC